MKFDVNIQIINCRKMENLLLIDDSYFRNAQLVSDGGLRGDQLYRTSARFRPLEQNHGTPRLRF